MFHGRDDGGPVSSGGFLRMEGPLFSGLMWRRFRFCADFSVVVVVRGLLFLMALPSFTAKCIARLSCQLFGVGEPIDVQEGRIDPFIKNVAKPGEGDQILPFRWFQIC